tara:strand:- start:5426 stop:6034 length:609 start_codon:yes stop_codon:yes gene_type:complete
MGIKHIYQLIIFISIFVILMAFYYSFFYKKRSEIVDIPKEIKETDIELKEKILNELENIEFNSTDSDGNLFYINAKKATVKIDNENQNKINLIGVISIINLKDKGIINIYSDNAIYDKVSHDTLFFNNVKSDFYDNTIVSQNLDVLFTKKISRIYNKVVFNNNKLELNTDNILIDMQTGDIKLEMHNKQDKVILFTKNDFIN